MNANANTGAPENMVHVFVSYAREDQKWLDLAYRHSLIPFLAESLRKHDVAFWFDKELKPGDEFRRHIESQIDQAQIALLIVSQNFLNSAFIEREEIPRIAERARQGLMIVVPVLVEPCDWSDYPFLADRQMVPSSPLVEYTESESQWAKVKYQILDGLKAQVKRIREPRRPAEPAPAWTPPSVQQPGGAAKVPMKVAHADSQDESSTRRPGEWKHQGATVASPLSLRIPRWAWGGGAVSVLLLALVFVGVHFSSHPNSASAPPVDSAPSQSVPGNPEPAGVTQAAPPVSPSNTPVPAQSPSRTAKPFGAAPGTGSGGGSSLPDVMRTIQDEMNSIGSIKFTAFVHNSTNGSTTLYTQTEQITNVVADPAQCRVSFHHTVWQSGAAQPSMNKTSWFMLHDVASITFVPGSQHLTQAFARAGKPNLVANSVTPLVTYVVLLSEPEGWTNEPLFVDSGSAFRFAINVRQAVSLCGGNLGNK